MGTPTRWSTHQDLVSILSFLKDDIVQRTVIPAPALSAALFALEQRLSLRKTIATRSGPLGRGWRRSRSAVKLDSLGCCISIALAGHCLVERDGQRRADASAHGGHIERLQCGYCPGVDVDARVGGIVRGRGSRGIDALKRPRVLVKRGHGTVHCHDGRFLVVEIRERYRWRGGGGEEGVDGLVSNVSSRFRS